jgi:type IV secretory pathway TraG/TraD family ATPase VirD4
MALKDKDSPTIFGRWFEGQWKPFAIRLGYGFLICLITLPFAAAVSVMTESLPPNLRQIFGADVLPLGDSVGDTGLFTVILMLGYTIWLIRFTEGEKFRQIIVESTALTRLDSRMEKMGRGGSARFGGLIDEWAHPYKPGSVLLGRSLYDSAMIGFEDDRGLLTIASNRSGKGRSGIIPNLLVWPGSAVVIDPKGTNAAVTAARRGKGGGRVSEFLGHDVYVVDPFGITPGITSAIFNPLDSLDLKAITAKEDVDLLADALVVSTGEEDSHWNESAKQILAGLIAHLKSQETILPATLVDVRQALLGDIDERDTLFGAMQKNPVAGGAARAAASLILNASDKERGSMMTTVLRNTGWLDSIAMTRVMTTKTPNFHNGKFRTSDFAMADVKTRPTTIYVVLPPEYLEDHKRFMRLFVNLTVRAAARGGKSKIPILLIMDEFYSLGTLATLAKASGALAGYGLKLWPILQNLSQLSQLYPQNWQTFFANAGSVQIFGVNDRETAQEIVQRLGSSRWAEKIDDRTVAVISNLIEPHELEELTDRSTGLQLVMRSGRSSLLLQKAPYDLDPLFNKAMYNPDPEHINS